MILVGNQRGGASNLAHHLLSPENEHVHVHEVSGFASDNLHAAFNEAHAIARGTRCRQFLFSLSLNPPEGEAVSVEDFERAVAQAERRLGLSGQPRAIVFHEKEGRRHCHAVWSRIDAARMKAVQLSYSKRKLQDVSRELYREYGWKMPRGLLKQGERDLRNFTLDEWQQARRMGRDPRDLKQTLKDCWSASDGRASFEAALQDCGFKLAKGDRRGFVAVSCEGEVFSVARAVGQKAKNVKMRLGAPDKLPSVDEMRAQIRNEMTSVLQGYLQEADLRLRQRLAPFARKKDDMNARHREQRREIEKRQKERAEAEAKARATRLRKGVLGLWDRLTGRRTKILSDIEREADAAKRRDTQERDALIQGQLRERRKLQDPIRTARQRHAKDLAEIRWAIARYCMEEPDSIQIERTRRRTRGRSLS